MAVLAKGKLHDSPRGASALQKRSALFRDHRIRGSGILVVRMSPTPSDPVSVSTAAAAGSSPAAARSAAGGVVTTDAPTVANSAPKRRTLLLLLLLLLLLARASGATAHAAGGGPRPRKRGRRQSPPAHSPEPRRGLGLVDGLGALRDVPRAGDLVERAPGLQGV